MRWGFTPVWARSGRPGPINAPSETAADKAMFRDNHRGQSLYKVLLPLCRNHPPSSS